MEKEKETHLEKEAELETYLDSLKPKKKSLKEMLAALPNFKKDFKPQLGGGGAEKEGGANFIILDDDEEPKTLTRGQRKMEELKARFVRQVMKSRPLSESTNETDVLNYRVKPVRKRERRQLSDDEEEDELSETEEQEDELSEADEQEDELSETDEQEDDLSETEEQEDDLSETEEQEDDLSETEEQEDDLSETEEQPLEKDYVIAEQEKPQGPFFNKRDRLNRKFVEDEAELSGSEEGSADEDERGTNHYEIEEGDDEQLDLSDVENQIQRTHLKQLLDEDDRQIRYLQNQYLENGELTMKSQSLSESTKETNLSPPTLPELLANVISETETKFDDLVDLCSGKFVTQANSAGLAESQEEDEEEFANFDFGDNDKLSSVEKDNEDENREEAVRTPLLEKLNSSKTAMDGYTPKLNEKIPTTRKLFEQRGVKEVELTSDNAENNEMDAADDSEDEEMIGRRKQVRKKKRLQFSDDEDDDGNNEQPVSAPPSEDELSETEEQPLEEDYVIEEPEKPQGLFFNKHGRFKRKFVEDEAELSGSEEGSADEDERGMNHYEMEEGDDEQLDLSVVQNQVERAHLKQLLDDDDRHIRYLQNQYLEDGDLHSDKQRERKFKWLDMSALNDDAHMGDSDEEQTEENPEEVSLKQAWVEKRKWMTENSHLLEPDVDESQSLFSNSRFVKIGKSTLRKIESFVECSSDSKDLVIKENSKQRRSIYEEILKAKSEAKKAENKTSAECTSFSEGFNVQGGSSNSVGDKSALSQPMFGEQMWSKTSSGAKKGSFLSRGGMILAKLAETSKPADAVSNVKNNSRNFVFTHITPPNQEKADRSTSRIKRIQPKTLACGAQAKKIKVDRSFQNLDEASKGNSIFKYF